MMGLFGRIAAFLFSASVWIAPVTASPSRPHYDMAVHIDPASRTLSASVTLDAASLSGGTFGLVSWLAVDRARVGETPIAVVRQGRIWQVEDLPSTAGTVTLHLSGTIPALPPENARRGVRGAVASAAEGTYVPYWAPEIGAEWITYRLTLSVDGGQIGVATGRLIDEERQGEIYRATFEATYPAAPPSLFVGPYEVAERFDGPLRIRTYFHPELKDMADHYLPTSARYIRALEEQIGPYPFQDFHIISAPLPVGLGFPNLTYIGRGIVRLPFMRGRSLAHEIAHNWWGNGVAVDYASGNWSEGLTTFMADYQVAENESVDAAREMRLRWLRDFAAVPPGDARPITAFVARTHQASRIVGYNKTAFLFHMLRAELGEAAFRSGIQAFWQTHRFQTASWADMQRSFEQASGKDLEVFFSQWLTRADAPRIELADAKVTTQEGGFGLQLNLTQGEPTYRVTVPIEVETAQGVEQFSVTLEDKTYRVDQTFKDPPMKVRVDPNFDVFRELLPGESPPILRDVTLAPSPGIVLLDEDQEVQTAARALVQSLTQRGVLVDPTAHAAPPDRARIVIGTRDRMARFVAEVLNQEMPGEVQAGTAAAWTARHETGQALLLIAGDDTRALEALIRPLRHYGSRSYVVFDGRRALTRGVWQVEDSPLSVRLTTGETRN